MAARSLQMLLRGGAAGLSLILAAVPATAAEQVTFVSQGGAYQKAQTIAILDSYEATKAEGARLDAELRNAQAERQRYDRLFAEGFVSTSERDTWRTKVEMLQAQLQHAKAELDLAVVRAPISGRVLDVHARQGERSGGDHTTGGETGQRLRARHRGAEPVGRHDGLFRGRVSAAAAAGPGAAR